ncbi:MAG: hypothetical protein Q8Q60_03850 [Candidatus Chromulinivorax sp.]|nr:hypothetical protein [Candidatus Chromulinivorax sp.]
MMTTTDSEPLKQELLDKAAKDDKAHPWRICPSVNICSGVRWLFRKQITASSRLKRKATWEEAIIEYKAYWKIIDAGQIPKAIVELREYYKQLEAK